MAYETLNEFSDWCYNSYVDAAKAGKYFVADAYWDVLKQHVALNLKGRKFSCQRLHARNLIKRIDGAMKVGVTSKLYYTGKKYEAQRIKDLIEYEQLLRRQDFPEDSINYFLNLKKENYGNEFL